MKSVKAKYNLPAMAHPFGELLSTFRARKPGLTQARLAKAIGYDAAVLARMCSGQRDLTGPSGREKIVFIIAELHREDVLHSLAEANSLLAAASMPPLYEGVPAERILIDSLKGIGAKNQPAPITDEIGMPSHFVQHNLPAPITTFVGRESEIAELAERLITTRLLTLTGAGGSGKTRLALRIASLCAGLDVPNEQSHFDALRKKIRWVWWIDLTLAADEPDLLRPIARVLNVDEGSGQHLLESLIARLRDEVALLVLDNCEHLVQPCVAFVIAALQGCHRLIILATSRELLNIMGEAVWRVPGLQLHAESAGLTVVEQDWPDSIRLFCIRATAINQHFAPSLHDLSIIAHICERLDGMPLAIELAATQLHHLTLVDIAARLDDQFNLLAHEKRMTLPRHQTLRTTLEWSDSLLSEDERRFFHHLGVFTGVWSADAAGAITGVGLASAGMLDRLVSKSLL